MLMTAAKRPELAIRAGIGGQNLLTGRSNTST